MTEKPIVPHEIRRIYNGRIFSVVAETVTLPNGHRLTLDVVRHPGSVVIAPVADDGRVILVRQYRHAVGRALWELPAGSLKAGEDPDRAAMRECHEETGLVPGRMERVGSLYPTPGYCDEIMLFYKASRLREPGAEDEAHPDDDEDLERRAFALDELFRMIGTGEIADLKTLGGLYFIRG